VDKPFAAYKGDEPYVFASYSHDNSSAVFPELIWLKERGFNIWYDEGIEAGTEWREEIGGAVKNASLFLYFVSPESAQSENCHREVSLADKEHVPIVAIHLKNTDLPDGLDLTLSDRQAILKYEIPKQEYQRKLQSSISSYLDQRAIQPVVEERKRTVPILASAAGVIVLASGLFFYNQQTITNDPIDLAALHSIGVLPFANMSTNEEIGFLADGLSEDILDNLAQTENIKVASRSASFQFMERGQDPSTIGEKLKVAYLIEGSVRERGDNVRITTQLIRTEDGFQVWSKAYERKLADGFEMQTAVATNIANIAESKLNSDVLRNYGWKQQKAFDGVDPVAVQHYINATDEYNDIRLGEGGDLEIHVQLLKNALEVDPNFYAAYPSLVNGYLMQHAAGKMSLREARPAAHAAITSTLALAPGDSDVQFAVAYVQMILDLQYASAEAVFRQLLKQNPKNPWAHYRLGSISVREGRRGEALRQMAKLTDAASTPLLLWGTAWIRCIAGDYEGALKASALALKRALGGYDRAFILNIHARSLVMLGRAEEARPFVEEGWNLERSTNPDRYVALFADVGEIEKAEKILTDLSFDFANHYWLAIGYLALGDIDNAFRSIQAGIENHDPLLFESLIVAEWWNPIRDDPRFNEMLELLDSKVTHTQTYLNDIEIHGK